MSYESKDFTLISEKLPKPYFLIILQNKEGRTCYGWHTGNNWEFSRNSIDPYSWKSVGNKIFFKGEYKKY